MRPSFSTAFVAKVAPWRYDGRSVSPADKLVFGVFMLHRVVFRRGWTFYAALAVAGLGLIAGPVTSVLASPTSATASAVHAEPYQPSLFFALPFVALLLCIAVFPLAPHRLAHWWENNANKLKVSVALGAVTLGYYLWRSAPFHGAGPGLSALGLVIEHAVFSDYIPFIVLLFCLYTISGGIKVSDDIPAHPLTNTVILAIGAVLANLIGTTGASMVLIRPLLQINSERKQKVHTVIFFIFIVSNIAGCLTPIGDPPLFLGYLRGVPFLWTLTHLWPEFLFCNGVLLGLYFLWDTLAYRRERPEDIQLDEAIREPFHVRGGHNLVFLAGVVFVVATMQPHHPWLGTAFVPRDFMREAIMLLLTAAAYLTTSARNRLDNGFNFGAITEVACLFIGIFITMQVPMEYLQAAGPGLGFAHVWQYFWGTGVLSSFLDNAPTYAVFFELARANEVALTHVEGFSTSQLLTTFPEFNRMLMAVSAGAVFMGANTYIGNGPNFMVKSIAESSGVKMPGFFGYMLYSGLILIPLFVLVTVVFMR